MTNTVGAFRLVNRNSVRTLGAFGNSANFLSLCVLILVANSILSISHGVLVGSFTKFIPAVLTNVTNTFNLTNLMNTVANINTVRTVTACTVPIVNNNGNTNVAPVDGV